MTDRMDRVSEAIKRAVSEILNEEVNDPRIRDVTITGVEVTRDLRLAKISYVSSAVENKEKRDIAGSLDKAGGFIRRELTKKVALKFYPRISFREEPKWEKET